MRGKKGNIVLVFLFFAMSIIVIIITALLAPVGINFSSEFYLAGQDILERTQPSIDQINDSTIRGQVNQSIESAKDAYVVNVQVSSGLYQYSWVFLVIIAFLVVFIATRSLAEFRQGGGGIV